MSRAAMVSSNEATHVREIETDTKAQETETETQRQRHPHTNIKTFAHMGDMYAHPILHKNVFKGIALVLRLNDTGCVHNSGIGWPVTMHYNPGSPCPIDRLQVLSSAETKVKTVLLSTKAVDTETIVINSDKGTGRKHELCRSCMPLTLHLQVI